MPDARESWDEVGKVLEGLGLKLKMHLEGARDNVEGKEVGDALKAAASAVDGAFDALGNAVRDPAVKDDVRRAASALSDAVSNTFSELSRNIQGRGKSE
jgi:hypothetical protein